MNLLDYFKTKTFDFVNYVHLTEDESRAIWKGRNHPDVRKWMTDPNPFSWVGTPWCTAAAIAVP